MQRVEEAQGEVLHDKARRHHRQREVERAGVGARPQGFERVEGPLSFAQEKRGLEKGSHQAVRGDASHEHRRILGFSRLRLSFGCPCFLPPRRRQLALVT